ncbi:MAG: Sjogren's syndrome/scleroderma autoantigen 1 family protein [Halobacteriota archaeon]
MPLDDRELEQISKMLERGGKMLADHCETCYSPLFKFEGKVTCPVCSYRATQTPVTETEHAAVVETQPLQAAQSPRARQSLLLDEAIAEFVSNLAVKMSTETDLARIQGQLECIERGLRIIQLVRAIDSLVSTPRRLG